MDARHFLGMEPTDDPLRWRLPVTPAVSTPGRFLYGGCGLAAGIVALEEASGRPTVWATAQYLAYAPTGTVLDWEVALPAAGRNTTQGRAIGRLGAEEVLTVNGALGSYDLDLSGTWVAFPDVPRTRGVPDPADPADVRRHRPRCGSSSGWHGAGPCSSSTADPGRPTRPSGSGCRATSSPRPPPWP